MRDNKSGPRGYRVWEIIKPVKGEPYNKYKATYGSRLNAFKAVMERKNFCSNRYLIKPPGSNSATLIRCDVARRFVTLSSKAQMAA